MKKQLPTNGIANELVGSSVFFGARSEAETPEKPDTAKQTAQIDGKLPRAISGTIKPPSSQPDSTQPRQRDSMVASNHATMPQRRSDTTDTDNHPAMREDKRDPLPPQPSDSEMTDEFSPATIPDVPTTLQANLEEVRKAVRPTGKEAATYRLTVAEKQALSDIAYTYQRRRIKTSENEIARIAINWLLLDYQAHKTDSVLARLLDLLHG